MEIRPATIAQVQQSANGRMIAIDDDVQGVAAGLLSVDPGLRLRYSEAGEYFVVYHEREGGEDLVLTAQSCDHRILQRVRRIADGRYSFTKELEKVDAQAERDVDRRHHERVGPLAELFAFVARKDRNIKSDIVVPKDVADDPDVS